MISWCHLPMVDKSVLILLFLWSLQLLTRWHLNCLIHIGLTQGAHGSSKQRIKTHALPGTDLIHQGREGTVMWVRYIVSTRQ